MQILGVEEEKHEEESEKTEFNEVPEQEEKREEVVGSEEASNYVVGYDPREKKKQENQFAMYQETLGRAPTAEPDEQGVDYAQQLDALRDSATPSPGPDSLHTPVQETRQQPYQPQRPSYQISPSQEAGLHYIILQVQKINEQHTRMLHEMHNFQQDARNQFAALRYRVANLDQRIL